MNLKSRITRLELAMSETEGVCECFRPRMEIYMIRELQHGEFSEPKLSGEPIPNHCESCLKPIEKEELIIRFVKSRTPDPRISSN